MRQRLSLIFLKAALAIKEGRINDAIEALEQIQKREPDNERNLLATAACYMQKKTPMRAAQILKNWLSTRPDHEAVQNALGAALERVDNWNEAYWSMQRFYMYYDAALDRKRTGGTKRWGTDWINVGLADSKWEELADAQAEYRKAVAQIDIVKRQLGPLLQQRDDARSGGRRFGFYWGLVDLSSFDATIARADSQLRELDQSAQNAYRIIRKVEPHFPSISDTVE